MTSKHSSKTRLEINNAHWLEDLILSSSIILLYRDPKDTNVCSSYYPQTNTRDVISTTQVERSLPD